MAIRDIRSAKHTKWKYTAASYAVVNEDLVLVNTAGGPVTITLPASRPAGARKAITIVDVGGAAATNPVTVAPAGADVVNGNAGLTLDVNYGQLKVYDSGVSGTPGWTADTGPGTFLPQAQYTSISGGNGTLAAGNMEGAADVTLATSGATALTTRTAAQIFAGVPNAVPGFSYRLRIYNTNAGTLTLTGGTNVTITGTATVATNVWRDYYVTLTDSTHVTLQNLGSGTAN